MANKSVVLGEIDLRDAHVLGNKSVHPYYDQKVRVCGSTKSGTTEMFGVLTGVTFNKPEGSDKVTQIIVYMEGQQNSVFDATKSGVWIVPVEEIRIMG